MALTHNKDIDPYPEPHDLYTLLHRRLACNAYYCYPKEFNHSFFLCGDTAINLALEISDTNTAMFFINKYKRNKAVVIDTLSDGTLNPRWSDTYIGEYQTSIADSIPLGKEFWQYKEKLREKNYPEKLLATYAQVCMLASRNVGVTMKMQVNGKLKQLSAEIDRDPNTGVLLDIIIKICD